MGVRDMESVPIRAGGTPRAWGPVGRQAGRLSHEPSMDQLLYFLGRELALPEMACLL